MYSTMISGDGQARGTESEALTEPQFPLCPTLPCSSPGWCQTRHYSALRGPRSLSWAGLPELQGG